MRGLIFIVILAGIVVPGMILYARRAARRDDDVDPKAFGGVRLQGDGAGWIYEYGWPKRRKPKAETDDSHQ